jgi:chorismate mutase-like protein
LDRTPKPDESRGQDPFGRVSAIVERLERRPPDADGSSPTVADLRDGIDLLDQAILELLNKRVVYATIIGKLKKSVGAPVYVPKREADVLENVRSSNRGPLHDDAVRRLFERIIDETRSLERKNYQDVETPSEGSGR